MVFAAAVGRIKTDTDQMLAEHSAAGRLQSGITIARAIKIYEAVSAEAVDSLCAEAGRLIEHRGRAWSKAMAGLAAALQAHLERGSEILAPAMQASGNHRNSVREASDERIAQVAVRLRERLAVFREGWTAPVAKPWSERHKVLWAVLLLAIGAGIKTVGDAVTALLR